MTDTYRGSGDKIQLTAAQTYVGGRLYILGSIPAIALDDYESGDVAAFTTVGEHLLPFNASDTAVQGALAFWDATAAELVDTDTGTTPPVGRFAAATTDSYALLRLGDVGDAPPAAIAHAHADGTPYALAAQPRDIMLTVDTAAGAVEVDLPTAASMKGRRITIVRGGTGTNAITIDQAGSETINGSGTAVATLDAQHDLLTLQSNGTGWMIISSIISS